MSEERGSIEHHYAVEGLTERLLTAITRAGLDVDSLSEAELGEFHTAGRALTERLADAAGIDAGCRVIDVGAGVGGPARYLAANRGATVTAVDLVDEFCVAARELNRRTGLADRVEIVRGSATDLRFAAGAFDVVWTQHLAMNIEDKHALYTGFRRVVPDGGKLAFFDIVAGDGGPIHLPVPWASERGQSFLEPPEVIRRLVEATGWRPLRWDDPTDELLAVGPVATGELGPQLLMDDAETKVATYRRNLTEGRTRLLLAVCEAV